MKNSFENLIKFEFGLDADEALLWRILLNNANINTKEELANCRHYIGFTRKEMLTIYSYHVREFNEKNMKRIIDGMIYRFKKYIYIKSYSHQTLFGQEYRFSPKYLILHEKLVERIFEVSIEN